MVCKKVLVVFGGEKYYSKTLTKKKEAVRLSGSIASVLYKTEEVLSYSQLGNTKLSL